MVASEVLCVADDVDTRNAVLSTLGAEPSSVDVVAVNTPEEALERIERTDVVGVVTTYEFPGSDLTGADILRHVWSVSPSTACLLYADVEPGPIVTDDDETVEYRQVSPTQGTPEMLRSSLREALTRPVEASFPVPLDEDERLSAVANYPLDYGPLQESLDGLAALVGDYFDVLFANVHVVDAERQRSLACRGPESLDSDRGDSVCTYTILSAEPTVIADLSEDDRFAHRSYVEEYGLGGYAGVPITTRSGYHVGTVCVLDDAPFDPDTFDTEALKRFARQASEVLDLYRYRYQEEQERSQ